MRVYLFLVIVAAVLLTVFLVFRQNPLWFIERLVGILVPAPQVTVAELRDMISDAEKSVLLLDVRSRAEYETSRIAGAEFVPPDITGGEFAEKFGNKIRGKHVVFYCSAGYRSSVLLNKVAPAALDSGAASISNLSGGVFKWYNNRLPLVDNTGPTDKVHPYGESWRFLLRDSSSNNKETK